MREISSESREWEPRVNPTLIKGLSEAARNGVDYFVDRINHALDFDPNADTRKPVKKPNVILADYIASFREI